MEKIKVMQIVEEGACDIKEVPVQIDGSILLSTLSILFPGACGLKYCHPKTKRWKRIPVDNGRLYPTAKTGWTNKKYVVILTEQGEETKENPLRHALLHPNLEYQHQGVKCELCNKVFKGEMGIDMHMKAKHQLIKEHSDTEPSQQLKYQKNNMNQEVVKVYSTSSECSSSTPSNLPDHQQKLKEDIQPKYVKGKQKKSTNNKVNGNNQDSTISNKSHDTELSKEVFQDLLAIGELSGHKTVTSSNIDSNIKSDAVLHHKGKIKKCGGIFNDENKLGENIKYCNPFDCEICPKKCTGKLALEMHMKAKHPKCDICSKVFGEKMGLEMHVKAKHPLTNEHLDTEPYNQLKDKKNVRTKVKEEKVSTSFERQKCGGIFKDENKLGEKRKSCIPFDCESCPKQFTDKIALEMHMKAKHPKCDICSKVFGEKMGLEMHVKAKHLLTNEHLNSEPYHQPKEQKNVITEVNKERLSTSLDRKKQEKKGLKNHLEANHPLKKEYSDSEPFNELKDKKKDMTEEKEVVFDSETYNQPKDHKNFINKVNKEKLSTSLDRKKQEKKGLESHMEAKHQSVYENQRHSNLPPIDQLESEFPLPPAPEDFPPIPKHSLLQDDESDDDWPLPEDFLPITTSTFTPRSLSPQPPHLPTNSNFKGRSLRPIFHALSTPPVLQTEEPSLAIESNIGSKMREVISNTEANREYVENNEEASISMNKDSLEIEDEKENSYVSNNPTNNTSCTPYPEEESRDLDTGDTYKEIEYFGQNSETDNEESDVSIKKQTLEGEDLEEKSQVSNRPVDITSSPLQPKKEKARVSTEIDDKHLEEDKDSFENEPINSNSGTPEPKDLFENNNDDDTNQAIPEQLHIKAMFNFVYNPEYINLCTEFADSEVFLVDMDSLFFETMEKENSGSGCYAGCSSLHVIYLMEKALSEFVRRGGKFHLVCYKSAKHLYKNPSILLIREAVLLHFKKNTNISVRDDFENTLDENFKSFLESEKPTFILTLFGNISYGSHFSDYFQVNFQMYQIYNLNCADLDGICSSTSQLHGWYIKAKMGHPPKYISHTKSFHNKVLSVMKQDAKVEKFNEGNLDVLGDTHYGGIIAMVKGLSHSNSSIANIFIISEILKKNLPLSYRVSSETKYSLSTNSELSKQMEFLYSTVIKYLPLCVKECISDIVDTQFMLKVIHKIHTCSTTETIPNIFQNEIKENGQILSDFEMMTTELLATKINLLKPFVDHNVLREFYSNITESNTTSATEKKKDFSIFSIDNPLYNQYVGSYFKGNQISRNTAEETEDMLKENRKFEEKYHWHLLKKLSDDHDRIRDNKQNTYQKHNQKNANYMTKYGSSIEGKIMSESPIVVDKNCGKKAKGTKPEKQKESVRKIQAQNSKQKFDKECKEILDLKYKDVEKESLQKTISHFEGRYNHYIKSCMNVFNEVEMTQLRKYFKEKILKLYLKLMKTQFEEFKMQDGLEEKIVLTVRKLTTYILEMDEKQKHSFQKYLIKLGYFELMKNLGLSQNTKENVTGGKSIARFQLEHMGKHLEMESPAEADPRVDSFNPDIWQRKLFDAIDKKESALIVAPTSSGKTYASYYCMETILRESDDGVVIYVSPTKALVNQVAATVCARFSHRKNLPPGKTVYGVFTRDFRENTLNSQILVTVPECLEILLFSPQRIEWAKRIRYVIFDEVHNIGAESRGEVWEHTMMLIRCPFLALSATIENPQDLLMWLQKAEDFKRIRDLQDKNLKRDGSSYKVNLVIHTERHSDLERCVFTSEEGKVDLLPWHPIASLSHLKLNIEEGEVKIPDHIRLSPKECIQLYDVLEEIHGKDSVKKIEPSVFCGEFFFKRNVVTNYANALKLFLSAKLQELGTTSEKYLNVVVNKLMHKSKVRQEDIKQSEKIDEQEYLESHFIELMLHLKQNNLLPAIVFVFNRRYCEYFATEAALHFEDEIENIKKTQEHKLKQKSLDSEKRLQEKMTKKLRDKEEVDEKDAGFLVDGKTALRYLTEYFESFPAQSFISKNNLGNDTAEFILKRLDDNTNEAFIDCLKFGISWHHAGNNARLRGSTEMLFREKFVNVAVSTTTLAQGIHMPCKSVIFAGDSVFLNSLNYHQCSGRAGRRGFDTEGNVVFYGIPSKKIARLMNAKLPKLVGNNPTSISLILRLLVMTSTDSEEDNKDSLSRALCLLENPLIALENPDMRSQLKHFFIYGCEFLAKQSLIDRSGNAVGFSGLVCHLHFYEPYNLAFCHLLRSQVFHSLCVYNKFGNFSEESIRNLLITVSFLFARRKLPGAFYNKQKMKFPTSNSIILLPPLPEVVKQSLQEFNQEINSNFHNYLHSVSRSLSAGKQDNILPLSNIEYQVRHDDLGDNSKLISPFAMLSGLTDDSIDSENTNSQGINSNIRQRILTEPIPKLDMKERLNSYALDFYNHGIHNELIKVNGLQHGEVFNVLKDFMLLLKAISTSLKEIGPSEDPLGDLVVKAFSQLSDTFEVKFHEAFNMGSRKRYEKGCIQEHPSNCEACDIISPGQTVITLGETRKFGIRGRFSCSTGWVVYYLKCQNCRIQYVGTSIQPLVTKVREMPKNFHKSHKASLMIVDGTSSGNHKELNNKKIMWIGKLQAVEH